MAMVCLKRRYLRLRNVNHTAVFPNPDPIAGRNDCGDDGECVALRRGDRYESLTIEHSDPVIASDPGAPVAAGDGRDVPDRDSVFA